MATHVVRLPIDDLPAKLSVLESELGEGNTIELVRGNHVIGEVHAPQPRAPQAPLGRPDFARQLQQLWGDQELAIDTTAWVRDDRDARG